jgi:hypothetical protein
MHTFFALKRNGKNMKRNCEKNVLLSFKEKNFMQKGTKKVNFVSLVRETGKYEAKRKASKAKQSEINLQFYFTFA